LPDPRVLIIDPAFFSILERVRQGLSEWPVGAVHGRNLEELGRVGAEAEVLVWGPMPITTDMLDALPRLRFMQQAGVGVDTVDRSLLRDRGILLANNPGANAASVAEHTLALMLALIKQVIPAERAFQSGRFAQVDLLHSGIDDLAGATVGLVGMGAIGREVAVRMQAFGANMLYTTRTRIDSDTEARLGATWVPMDALLTQSDIVSLHLLLTAETAGIINAKSLAQMKRGAYLVNTSRGGLVDEDALRAALTSGHLRGAALDVLQHEQDGGNPFVDLPQVLVTPHVGGGSRGGFNAMADGVIANVRRFLTGEPLRNRTD
jgi:phosphoglycerate dehydrogenase-like enzyme